MIGTAVPVVITGVTRGLGRALALRLAGLGHPVAGCGRDETALAELAADLGGDHLISRVDVTDAAAMDTWAGRVVDRFGGPGVVIASAGAIHPPARAWEISPEVVDQVLRVNVFGVFTTTRAFVPVLRESGVILNLSSGWGRNPKGTQAAYTASKFAVEGFTRAVAEEVGPGVRVMTLDPGDGVDTDMLATCLPDEHQDYAGPEAWARVAVDHLAATLPTATNGASLIVPRVS